jgi:putative inorganic carbon (HCO3(-)) transporter
VKSSLPIWMHFLLAAFLAVNSICILNNFFWFPLISGLLVVAYLAITNLPWFFVAMALITPISIWYEFTDFGFSFSMPTEPIFFGMMVFFWAKVLIEGSFDRRLYRHPVFIALLVLMIFQVISILTSTMIGVSAKYFLSNFWYISCFFFLGFHLFQKPLVIKQFMWAYIIPFSLVILYALYRHAGVGFTHKATGWVTYPFVENHGIYGAMLTMCIPFLMIYFFRSMLLTKRSFIWIFAGALLIIFGAGLIFSFTRAAWLGMAVSFIIPVILYFRISFKIVLTSLIVLGMGALYYQFELNKELSRNKTHSANNLGDHLQSISNVNNDVSNLERLNRWNCGMRMFREKPFTGWGPGTYMFQYAPFQKRSEMTIISTNNADVGGIHSEYLNPTVESGIFAGIAFIAFVLLVIRTGINAYYKSNNPEKRILLVAVLMGLVTYDVHGVLNNYLDIDKTATLFWALSAMIVALDLGEKKEVPTGGTSNNQP